MPILVIRHGLSEANNRESLAFGSSTASLMDKGREQARQLGHLLSTKYALSTAATAVATSRLQRTQETAREAGFLNLSTYSVLDEVEHGMELTILREALDKKQLPAAAVEVAQAVLEDPPRESVWITHGLVIAGLCQVLGVCQDARFIPRFCEIRELPVGE